MALQTGADIADAWVKVHHGRNAGAFLSKRYVQIRHRPIGAVIAVGPLGFGVTPFEGNYSIRRRYLREGHFRADYIPGVCVYKGQYIGLNCIAARPDGGTHLGWVYWLSNPLFPFITFQVAVPADHPVLSVEHVDEPSGRHRSHRDRARIGLTSRLRYAR